MAKVERCPTCLRDIRYEWMSPTGRCKSCYMKTKDKPEGWGMNAISKPLLLVKSKPAPMKHGEIRKMPKGVQTPMFTEQWAVMGTGKAPYIISRKQNATQGFHWQCSCPSWTQNTPRADCKHIFNVKTKEGVMVEATTAVLPPDKQKLFEAFLKQQAEAGTPALTTDAKPLKFADKGRRFR